MLIPKTIECPECGSTVIACDNGVYLDWPAVSRDNPQAIWSIMPVATMFLAASAPEGDTAHTMHEHQPEEAS